MWLSPEHALIGAGALVVPGLAVRTRRAGLAAACREGALVFALYAFWRLMNRVDLNLDGAMQRGLQLWRFERRFGLGSERWLQRLVLDRSLVVQFLNGYYAIVHVPAMGVSLAWLWLRHRDRYAHVRSVLALSTAIDVVIRFVPVAPPRLLPELGFVDTARLYHQSVYGAFGHGVSDQLAAMPSIHAGWALLVAAATWAAGSGWPRRIGMAHAVLTMLAVVLTANHWWLDCIVGGLILWPSSLLCRAMAVRFAHFRGRTSPSAG